MIFRSNGRVYTYGLRWRWRILTIGWQERLRGQIVRFDSQISILQLIKQNPALKHFNQLLVHPVFQSLTIKFLRTIKNNKLKTKLDVINFKSRTSQSSQKKQIPNSLSLGQLPPTIPYHTPLSTFSQKSLYPSLTIFYNLTRLYLRYFHSIDPGRRLGRKKCWNERPTKSIHGKVGR